MELLAPAAEVVEANKWMTASERQTALERISVRHSIENLRTFPFIKDRLEDGRLRLRGAYFDIADGRLLSLDPESGRFEPLD